jgi:hypothetical protein
VRPIAFVVLLVLLLLAAACGPKSSVDRGTPVQLGPQKSTSQSGYTEPQPKVDLVKTAGLWTLTVFQGQQSTGGYSIVIERMTSQGTVLYVRARFTVPAAGALVTSVITSPASSVELPFAPDEIVLFDQDDHERARFGR